MVDFLYPLICFICINILTFIFFQTAKSKVKVKRKKTFLILIGYSILYSIIDMVWGLIYYFNINFSLIHFIITILNFLVTTFLGLMFFQFVCLYCSRFIKYFRIIIKLSWIPVVCISSIFIIAIIKNYKVISLSFISPDSLYMVLVFINLALYYLATGYVALHSYIRSKKESVRLSRSIISFSLIPILTGILQYLSVFQPYISIGCMLSCFVVFVFEVLSDREYSIEEMIKNQQTEVLNSCSEILCKSSSPENNISLLIDLLAKYYSSKGVMIFEINENTNQIFKIYQWKKNNSQKNEKNIKKLSEQVIQEWILMFSEKTDVYIKDLNILKERFPNMYDLFCKLEIKNLIVVPIICDGKFSGAITIDSPQEFENEFTIAKTISLFIYSEIQKRRFIEKAQETSGSVIDALSEEYESVYHINLTTDELIPYRFDENMRRLYGQKYEQHIKYTPAYKLYVDENVADEDKEEMHEFGVPENLRSILKNRHSVVKKYKSLINGKPEFFEAKWIKIGMLDEEPEKVVLGFANINEKIIQKMREETERQLYQIKLDTAIEQAEEVERISQFDKLTQVYNKNAGLEIMNKYLSAKEEQAFYTLIFIDLDNFKTINDTFGHLEGDELLKGIGNAIQKKCRAGDIVVRFGGDEFIILLKNIDNMELAKKKSIHIATEISRLSIGKEYSSTCSIGGFITTSRDLNRSLEFADKSLYQVKKKGRDGVIIQMDSNL